MRYALFLLLAACGPDDFTRAPGDSGPDSGDASPLDAQGSETTGDGGGLDAREDSRDSSTVDTGVDSWVCPTGTPACNDAITAWCARMKTCCNGQCMSAWANAGGSQCAAQISVSSCSNKMLCETQCLSDLQSASCTDIKNSPAPAYVTNSCWGLWQ